MTPDRSGKSRRVVYTILLGNYETLRPQPALQDSEIDRFCFTDDPSLTSDTWTVVLVAPLLPADVIRSQREIKTRVHRYLAEYEASLYIDNTVGLKSRPEEILDEWLRDADMALAQHSFRDTVLEEFDEVFRLGYDDAVRVHEQLMAYAHSIPGILESKPLWTGMIARRHTPKVIDAMEVWFLHVARYSRRDQLSVRYSLSSSQLRVRELTHDNFESIWHTWSVDPSRKVAQGKSPVLPSGPLLAEVLRQEAEVLRLEEENAALRAEGDEIKTQLEEQRASLARCETRSLKATELALEIKARDDQILELKSSSSWRLTAPIRKLTNRLHRKE